MATNEAGILLMHKDLQKYVGSAAAIGSAGPSDSWLLAPDFHSGDERSQNVIDMQGHPDLCRRQGTKGRDNWGHIPPSRARTATRPICNGYIWQSNGYTGGEEQNQVAGRNVQRNERRTGLCGGLQGVSLRKRGRS